MDTIVKNTERFVRLDYLCTRNVRLLTSARDSIFLQETTKEVPCTHWKFQGCNQLNVHIQGEGRRCADSIPMTRNWCTVPEYDTVPVSLIN